MGVYYALRGIEIMVVHGESNYKDEFRIRNSNIILELQKGKQYSRTIFSNEHSSIKYSFAFSEKD